MKKKQKKQIGFGESLDKYIIKKVFNVPWRWEWVGASLVGLVITVSVLTGYATSPTLGADKIEIIKMAGERGDYVMAQELYSDQLAVVNDQGILGVNTELEELVYPERRLGREIERKEELLTRYPGSRDILLSLAELYSQTENHEKYLEYYEMARKLDPNGNRIR